MAAARGSAAAAVGGTATPLRLMDIAPNLTDPMFRGVYRGRQAHPEDLAQVLARARAAGVHKMMVTGSSLADSRAAAALVRRFAGEHTLFSTVGCHPCHAHDFDDPQNGGPDAYVSALAAVVGEDARESVAAGLPRAVVAIGECGLDFDREELCPRAVQLRHFERHFELAERFKLPMFLHDRNTGGMFYDIMRCNRTRFSTGVVHSFTGTADEMRRYVDDLDLYIGINGCSLKTEENLAVVRDIPLDKLMLETDAPWCEIRPSHASSRLLDDFDRSLLPESRKKERFEPDKTVRSRCEPCHIREVLHVVARLKGISDKEVADAAWRNTERVFFNADKTT